MPLGRGKAARMNNEDDRIFVKLKRHDGEFRGDSEDDSSLYKIESDNRLEENQTDRVESGYEHFKLHGFLSVRSSVILPITDGSVRLTMEEDDVSRENRAICAEPAAIRARRSSGSILAGAGNDANVTAVIRRRQQRRHFKRLHNRDLKCLRLVLTILYYVGLSPYRPQSSRTLPKALVQVLKIVHLGFVSIAILDSVTKLKMDWIEFRKEPKLLTIAETGISLIVVFTRLYTVKVIACMNQKMDGLLGTRPVSCGNGRSREISDGRKLEITIVLVLALSICMSVTSVVFGSIPFKSWSFSLQQRLVACETNELIAIWTPNNWRNVTDDLIRQYSDEISASMVLFAVIGDTVRYIGTLYDNLTVDFWLALSYQVYSLHEDLTKVLNVGEPFPTQVEFEIGWNMYMAASIACDRVDEIFGRLLKLVHVINILRLSEFLVDVMSNEASGFRVTSLIVLLKICVTYTICLMSADTNEKMHEQVMTRTDSNGCIQVNGDKLKLYAVRVEMDRHPIGIGRGNFLVEETFLMKMLCAAWSLFALIADHSND